MLIVIYFCLAYNGLFDCVCVFRYVSPSLGWRSPIRFCGFHDYHIKCIKLHYSVVKYIIVGCCICTSQFISIFVYVPQVRHTNYDNDVDFFFITFVVVFVKNSVGMNPAIFSCIFAYNYTLFMTSYCKSVLLKRKKVPKDASM